MSEQTIENKKICFFMIFYRHIK